VLADIEGAAGESQSLIDAQLLELWYRAEEIISKANEYGSVSYRGEEEAYEYPEDVGQLANRASQEARRKVIKSAMVQRARRRLCRGRLREGQRLGKRPRRVLDKIICGEK
jgi:hypothetical protein